MNGQFRYGSKTEELIFRRNRQALFQSLQTELCTEEMKSHRNQFNIRVVFWRIFSDRKWGYQQHYLYSLFVRSSTCPGILALMFEDATYRELHYLQYCIRENYQRANVVKQPEQPVNSYTYRKTSSD